MPILTQPSTDSARSDFRSGKPQLSANSEGSRVVHLAILIALVLLTRIPYLGINEPDSALFAAGLHQWIGSGPGGLFIYSAQVCATYYALMAGVAHLLHVGITAQPVLMSVFSLLGTLGVVVLGYQLGSWMISRTAAFGAMVLFALSPGLWWASQESHPQTLSLFFGLLSIWAMCAYVRQPRLALLALSAVSLGVAVALKNDAVLLAPAVVGMALFFRTSLKTFLYGTGVVLAAALVSLGLAHLVLGSGSQAVAVGGQAASSFLTIPNLSGLVKQSVPIVLGLGIVSAVLVFVAFVQLAREKGNAWRWWLVLVTWSMPGLVFYLLVSGNNIRHALPFSMPFFWLVGRYFRLRTVLVCAVLGFLVPANSNMLMFPSPNVIGSRRLVAAKQGEVQSMAKQLSTANSCFTGSYTNDYVAYQLLNLGGTIVADSDVFNSVVDLRMPNGAQVRLVRLNPSDKTHDSGACQSLEYDRQGRKSHFLGSEWKVPNL
jgi:hypothetical protein